MQQILVLGSLYIIGMGGKEQIYDMGDWIRGIYHQNHGIYVVVMFFAKQGGFFGSCGLMWEDIRTNMGIDFCGVAIAIFTFFVFMIGFVCGMVAGVSPSWWGHSYIQLLQSWWHLNVTLRKEVYSVRNLAAQFGIPLEIISDSDQSVALAIFSSSLSWVVAKRFHGRRQLQ